MVEQSRKTDIRHVRDLEVYQMAFTAAKVEGVKMMKNCYVVMGMLLLLDGFCFNGKLRGEELEDLYFHATLDETLIARQGDGETSAVNREIFKYEDAPVGKGLIISGRAITYRESETFPIDQGTIAFWVKPHWDPNKKNQFLFRKVLGIKNWWGNLIWFRLFDKKLDFRLGDSVEKKHYTSANWQLDWEKGQWKHIAGTWGGGKKPKLYVDGKLVATARKDIFPKEHAGTFQLGGPSKLSSEKPMTMDDLRIYKRALTENEIKVLFQMGDLGRGK